MKIIAFLSCLLLAGMARTQVLRVAAGTDLTILSGTIFKVDSLTLIPGSDFIITDNTLTKSLTVSHYTLNNYISRVYQFTNNTDPYSGSLQVDYTDGAELNGIPEASLTLNVHNGTSWIAYPTATRDGTNNFVLTNGLNAINLNEFTLASLSTPLPVVWLSFKVTRQNQTTQLEWATAQEENTRNFIVQHSADGINWIGIATVPAAGNSSIVSNYSYLHTTPVSGNNYYRLIQMDIDNRSNYSASRMIYFSTTNESFTIVGNPVSKNVVTLRVITTSVIALYTTDGRLLWQDKVNAGIKYIDVSRYAKGIYLLKSNSTIQKIVIQ
jgi:hypothetical protein